MEQKLLIQVFFTFLPKIRENVAQVLREQSINAVAKEGKIICGSGEVFPFEKCRDLKPDDAPKNGALVCSSNDKGKYCALR